MTQVDFYILQDHSENAKNLFACKLADKVFRLKHKVYINADTAQQASQLDNLLWTYNPGSFIPHGLCEESDPEFTPILIGVGDQSKGQHEVMINIGNEIPLSFSQFDRVAEIVIGNDDQRQQARQRFKFYRDRGYSLNTHEISN